MLCEFLSPASPPQLSDVAVVLAGRPERKRYGAQLFEQGLVRRLILSISRSEVRYTAALVPQVSDQLLELARSTPPEQRHFFLDREGSSLRITRAELRGSGTFYELTGLAKYLENAAGISSLMVVSTSIHLRRVRFCCQQIAFFRSKSVAYVAVPEEVSSFRPQGWWRHWGHWRYLGQEYVKLAAYRLLY